MRISITFHAAAFTRAPAEQRPRQEASTFRGSSAIDDLYQATMDSKETKDQALDSFWGPVLAETIPTHIYIEGTYFKNKSAGGGIYFGPGSPMNTKLLLSMLERPTADLARLVAIQEAVTMVPPDRSLLIFCTSKYMIRQLCYSTAKNNKED
jgi:hypothetical protein